VVRHQNRLGPLQMSVPRHHRMLVFAGQHHTGFLQPGEQLDEAAAFLPEVQTHIEGHLIVAAAGGVQFFPGRADLFHQGFFDVHVDVFKLRPEDKRPIFDLPLDLA